MAASSTFQSDITTDSAPPTKNAGIKNHMYQLPFVYVYERTDMSTTLYGLQIYPEIIKKEVQILRSNPECGMCHSHAESINSKVDLSLYEEKELTFQELILKNQVYAPTAMLRKKVVDELKGFDESLYIEDWDLWLRLTYSGYKICFINEVLAYYREHDGNSYKNHLRMEVATDQILNKWKGNEFYDLAIKNEKLRRFDFYAEIDKLRALNYLFFSLKNIGERRVRVGLIKLFIPLNLMNFLRKIRRRN